jgi:hypothetical protein
MASQRHQMLLCGDAYVGVFEPLPTPWLPGFTTLSGFTNGATFGAGLSGRM